MLHVVLSGDDNKRKRLAGRAVIGEREVSSPLMVNKERERERESRGSAEDETHAESGCGGLALMTPACLRLPGDGAE